MTSQKRDSQERRMRVRQIRRLGAARLREQGIDAAKLAQEMIRGLAAHQGSVGATPEQEARPMVPVQETLELEEEPRRLARAPQSIEALFDRLCTCPDGQGRLVRQGETLFGSGQEATTIFLIRQGVVRLNHLTLGGKKLILELRFAGDLVGERALAQRVVHEVSAVAVTRVRVCECRRADFLYALENNPRLLRELMHRLAEYALRRSEAAVRLCGLYGAHEKAAYMLVKLARRLGKPTSSNSVVFQLPLQRKDFAELIGVTPKTVIRTFRHWIERDWLEINGDHWTIYGLEQLERLAGNIWLPERKEG